MRHATRTNTDVTVKVLDLSASMKEALEHVQKTKPACHRVDPYAKWGIVLTKKGIYALNTEGVGPSKPITAKAKLQMEVYGHYKEGDREWADMMPCLILVFSKEELAAMPVAKEENLADFIKTFGRRMEYNYDVWRKELEKAA